MIYKGVVLKMELLYLFIINPDTNKLMDGINISEHKCYDNLNSEQIMVVDVKFKDGTKDIENFDLEEFIYGDSYGVHDVFLYIQDIQMYTNQDKNDKLINLVKQGKLNDIAKGCIENLKLKENKDV